MNSISHIAFRIVRIVGKDDIRRFRSPPDLALAACLAASWVAVVVLSNRATAPGACDSVM